MIDLHIVAAPILGGLIGLVTNEVAIKMLFYPLKPVKIGKFKVPFTPGLIPKEKERIAKAIGQVIGANLLDAETLTKALGSEKIKKAFDAKVDEIIDRMRSEERTIEEYAASTGYEETIDHMVAYVGNNLGGYVAERLVENQVGTQILDFAMQQVLANLNPMFVVIAESALEKSQEAILDKIDAIILEQCPDIIDGYLEKEYENWIDKPICDYAASLWQKKEVIKEKVWDMYLMLLEKKSSDFFKNLDVGTIVEEKIRDFDEKELEKLILEIAHKELNALVWIGGLLGTVIGFVNLLF